MHVSGLRELHPTSLASKMINLGIHSSNFRVFPPVTMAHGFHQANVCWLNGILVTRFKKTASQENVEKMLDKYSPAYLEDKDMVTSFPKQQQPLTDCICKAVGTGSSETRNPLILNQYNGMGYGCFQKLGYPKMDGL